MKYDISQEEFGKKYDEFLNKLFYKDDGYFHKLFTEKSNKEFGIFRSDNSVCVKPITEKETLMYISKKQLLNVVCNEKKYLYASYEPIVIDYIIDDKLNHLSDECKYSDYYETVSKDSEIIKEKKIAIKNIILYGAPGVGKTHNYQRVISMIENGENEKKIFDTITNNKSSSHVELNNDDIFQTIKDEKRVEFVTFHQ
nr:hypothetical protein [Sulfurospirillum sp.]